MKTIIGILTSIILTNANAALPIGKFRGSGLWKSFKEQGSYEVTTNINGKTMTSSYQLPNGISREWKFEIEPTLNGFFKVKTYGAEVGQGYCLERVEVCHYEIKADELTMEETLTILDGKLYRFGSKEEGSVRIMWQESMDKN